MKSIDIEKQIQEGLASSSKSLTEDKAKKIFGLFNIPVVDERLVTNEEEIFSACKETGFPIVLKAVGSTILHKTEKGMVSVGLKSEEEVQKALAGMRQAGGDAVEAFLVQPVVQGKREFMAGMFRDPQFGPVILFGLGGVFAEALADVVFKLPPLEDVDIEDMFDQLRSKNLLGSFRGEKPVDLKALKDILKGLSELAMTYDDIGEIDINPLIIRPNGAPVAVDGLIVLKKAVKKEGKKTEVDLLGLNACYYPRSLAFIGASATPGKWGHTLPSNTLSRTYNGKVFLVNPRGGTILGKDVYRSITDIEDPIDLAVVTIPAKHVINIIPDLKKKKVKGMLLITSGFRETDQEGARLEKEVVDAANEAGIMLLGPNTMGICNPHIDFYCYGSHAYPNPGSTTLVCQSGNMGVQLLGFAEQQGIGIRSFSGSGNEAMVTVEDYMEVFEIDKLTRTVVLYLESVKDGERFFRSAARVSRKKPIVVLKGGRTKIGEKAAASHSGAIASDIGVFRAACRQAGIIEVNQPIELLDLSAVFASLPLPKGNRVAIMTLGGGWGVITTDLCAEYGLDVPELPQTIIDKFDTILPQFWSRGNPVDIVGESDLSIPKICMEELAKWDGCDAVIHLGIHGRRIMVNNMAESLSKSDPEFDREKAEMVKTYFQQFEEDYTKYIVELTTQYEKPILGVSILTDSLSKTLYPVDEYNYKGVYFPSPERAVKALCGMVQYRTWLKSQPKS